MSYLSAQWSYFFILLILLFILYILSPILTPFLLGALLAYLFNPLVKRLGKYLPHVASVILIFLLLIGIILLGILTFIPLINKQLLLLSEILPEIISWLQNNVMSWITEFIDITSFKPSVSSTLSKTGWLFSTVIYSGYALVAFAASFILTIVITFYLLCDWDKILLGLRHLLPRPIESTVIKLVKECDNVLSAFFRGQLLVMLALAIIYGVGLSLIGLKVGFILGIIGGALSVVPFLGSIFVVVSGSIAALVQWGVWESLLWVWGVFIIGQVMESYFLTPYLIGERIGLHPLAVIFAMMTGGALFGFFGILLALPVAAVLMVLLRFMNKKYRASKLYF